MSPSRVHGILEKPLSPGTLPVDFAREKHLVGGALGLFGAAYYVFSPPFISTFIERLSARHPAGTESVETPAWGAAGFFTPTAWVPGVLAGELGLLWECVLATVTPPCLCVWGFMSPKRRSNTVGSPLGQLAGTQTS